MAVPFFFLFVFFILHDTPLLYSPSWEMISSYGTAQVWVARLEASKKEKKNILKGASCLRIYPTYYVVE